MIFSGSPPKGVMDWSTSYFGTNSSRLKTRLHEMIIHEKRAPYDSDVKYEIVIPTIKNDEDITYQYVEWILKNFTGSFVLTKIEAEIVFCEQNIDGLDYLAWSILPPDTDIDNKKWLSIKTSREENLMAFKLAWN